MSYVNGLQREFRSRGLRVLGIHAPEYDWEQDLHKYAEAKSQFGVAFPSYFDRNLSYCASLQFPGWPVIYVIDRQGSIRGEWFGEVHEGTPRAWAIENLVEKLLGEETSSS